MKNEFIYPLRFHIEDTDLTGLVYHVNYLNFMERARSEWLDEIGCGIEWQKKHHFYFVVHSAQLQFLKPGRVQERVEVVSKIKTLRPASLVLEQYLRDAEHKDKILGKAEIKLACVNAEMRPCVIPEFLQAIRRIVT